MNCIIILNYNNYEETLRYVNQIKNFKCLDIIIIVDNASSDHSIYYFEKIINKKIHLIKNNKNCGYNAGNNSGVIYAQENFPIKNIIISNPDIKIKENIMKLLFQDLELYPLVAPITYNMQGNIQSNCGWRLPTYAQSLANCTLISYKIQKMLGKSNYFSAINYSNRFVSTEAVSGCFFGITSEAYNKIGGFDEDVFLYGEEIILGAQLKKAKLICVIDKACTIVHEDQGAKIENYTKWKWHSNLIKESHVIYLTKYLNTSKIQIYLYKLIFNIGNYINRFIDMVLFYKNKK